MQYRVPYIIKYDTFNFLINYNLSSEFLCGSWSTRHFNKLHLTFYPRFQTAEERLSSCATGNLWENQYDTKRSFKTPRQCQAQCGPEMRPQVGMRVTPELRWDFHSLAPGKQAVFSL